MSTGTGTERHRPLLTGRATVNIEELSEVVGGSLGTSRCLLPGRKCTSEVRFSVGPPQKVVKSATDVRILGTEGATIPADPNQEATVALLTTTRDEPQSAGLSLLAVANLASSVLPQGDTRLTLGSDLPLSGSLTVGPHGDLLVSQVSSTGAASTKVAGSGQASKGGCARHIPAASHKISGDAEEIVIDDEEEELEDIDNDEDDNYSPS